MQLSQLHQPSRNANPIHFGISFFIGALETSAPPDSTNTTAPPNQLHHKLHPLTNSAPNQHNSAQIPLISINTENKSCLIFHVWIFIAKFARNKFFKLYVIICC